MAEEAQRGRKRKVAFAAETEVREYDSRPPKRARQGRGGARAAAADDDDEEDGGEGGRMQMEYEEDGSAPSGEKEGAEAHTLESDEEDEVNPARYKLTDEDIHEELDEKFTDGGVPVTAFNLKEEMEDGYFDENSNYVQAKDDEAAADAWLDGAELYVPPPKAAESEAKEEEPERSKLEVLKTLLSYMQPHESVTQTLKRLAGDKKKGLPADKQAVDAVTEALNSLLEKGMFEIYEVTYEKAAHDVQLMEGGSVLGMFEYKWTDEEEAEVHGPFTAQQMLDWKEQGFFGAGGVLARELGKGDDTLFYNTNRIDFDLFT